MTIGNLWLSARLIGAWPSTHLSSHARRDRHVRAWSPVANGAHDWPQSEAAIYFPVTGFVLIGSHLLLVLVEAAGAYARSTRRSPARARSTQGATPVKEHAWSLTLTICSLRRHLVRGDCVRDKSNGVLMLLASILCVPSSWPARARSGWSRRASKLWPRAPTCSSEPDRDRVMGRRTGRSMRTPLGALLLIFFSNLLEIVRGSTSRYLAHGHPRRLALLTYDLQFRRVQEAGVQVPHRDAVPAVCR